MRQSIHRLQNKHEAWLQGELLFLEHEDTITVTRQHGTRHLLVDRSSLAANNIELHETDRGGNITFHGRGQLVGYPVLKLPLIPNATRYFEVDLLGYVRKLENALLKSVERLGIRDAKTIPDKTGIWVYRDDQYKKLIAIGVGVSKGVTRHGFALNIHNDVDRFLRCMVPCGLQGMGVTTLSRELTADKKSLPSMNRICTIIADQLAQAFRCNLSYTEPFDPNLSSLVQS